LAAIIIPGQSGTYRHLPGHVTGLLAESGQTGPPTRESAALEAALQMKIRLDDAREALREERQANKRLTSLLAAVVAEMEIARAQSDRLDQIAEGYSEALAQLIIPDGPENAS
jgi:hypothetical protein